MVVREHVEHPIVNEGLHVSDHVCFQSNHQFVQAVINRFGVQRTDVAQADVFQDDRGADKVQSVDEQLVLRKRSIGSS